MDAITVIEIAKFDCGRNFEDVRQAMLKMESAKKPLSYNDMAILNADNNIVFDFLEFDGNAETWLVLAPKLISL